MSDKHFDELVRGIKLNSPKILDNIGIHINVSTLPSAELYWLVRGEWFGHWFLGRFYARYLRAIIEPDNRGKEACCTCDGGSRTWLFWASRYRS